MIEVLRAEEETADFDGVTCVNWKRMGRESGACSDNSNEADPG
jgi:hypothetical protein